MNPQPFAVPSFACSPDVEANQSGGWRPGVVLLTLPRAAFLHAERYT